MKVVCPYLVGSHMLSCKADRDVYIPSIHELDEYCKDKKHEACPFFCLVDYEKKFKNMNAA